MRVARLVTSSWEGRRACTGGPVAGTAYIRSAANACATQPSRSGARPAASMRSVLAALQRASTGSSGSVIEGAAH
eukprot:4799258-Lingulodinium_polyedra.AAC.1